jgi:AcrR family transcriptional regulator
MEPWESDIEKAVGALIDDQGIEALTVDTLALQTGIPKSELSKHFNTGDDILKFMALRLEDGIMQLISHLTGTPHSPEKQLADLFRNLDDFFNRKTYFLELMFSDEIHKTDSAVPPIVFGIRKLVGNYLTQIIETGKQAGTFKSHLDTGYEVEAILNRFRFYMSDLPLTHKLIRDLKKIREENRL